MTFPLRPQGLPETALVVVGATGNCLSRRLGYRNYLIRRRRNHAGSCLTRLSAVPETTPAVVGATGSCLSRRRSNVSCQLPQLSPAQPEVAVVGAVVLIPPPTSRRGRPDFLQVLWRPSSNTTCSSVYPGHRRQLVSPEEEEEEEVGCWRRYSAQAVS